MHRAARIEPQYRIKSLVRIISLSAVIHPPLFTTGNRESGIRNSQWYLRRHTPLTASKTLATFEFAPNAIDRAAEARYDSHNLKQLTGAHKSGGDLIVFCNTTPE